ncbi:ArsR/SmtB family transcription factor [Acetivibrio cellulolyticus]|uniref:ArsR/SmtB family transcription factor n=1 Tax=Acetivibrio cellulolyticus TaxID=35830 RepID=UPI0001E2F074|nr:metalloregulator ArsR/SmtB family transcription factor [Acetivibrio cellulolyticus]
MDNLINLFSILSDKTRLRILLLLQSKELCVCEIFAALNMSQPRVSRQLAILKQSKIIKDRREGKWAYYRIDENDYSRYLISIISMIPDYLKDDPEFNNDLALLQKISDNKNKTVSCKCLSGGEEHGR